MNEFSVDKFICLFLVNNMYIMEVYLWMRKLLIMLKNLHIA